MTSDFVQIQSYETLPQIFSRVWCFKSYVAIGFVVGLIIAAVLLSLLKPHYEATMIVAPPAKDSRTDSFVDGVVMVAPEVQAKIPTGSPEFIRFEQSLRGASVATLLMKIDGFSDAVAKDTLVRSLTSPVSSAEDMAEYLDRHVRIESVGLTASRKISYRHPDPDFAVKFLSMLRKVNDQLIRTSVRAESERKIEWLKEEFKKTLNPDHRQALAQLLMTEERRRMLLSLDIPYAVTVVEEASVAPRPVTPKPVFLLVMLSGLCAVVGAAIALIRSYRS